MLNSDPFSSRGRWIYRVPQGSEMHFFLALSHYIKKQNPKIYLRKREREAVNGPLGDLKES